MNRNDIVIGGIILAVLVGGFFLLRRDNTPALSPTPTPATANSVEQQIEDSFKVDIPDDVEKAELQPAVGGDGTGIATRKFENNRFTSTILVDLPAPAAGSFYQAWLISDDESHSLGRMTVAKGGYLLDYSANNDYSGFANVVISEEKSTVSEPTNIVLEGSF